MFLRTFEAPPRSDQVPSGSIQAAPGGGRAPPDGDRAPPDGDRTPPGGDRTPPGGDQTPPGGDQSPPARVAGRSAAVSGASLHGFRDSYLDSRGPWHVFAAVAAVLTAPGSNRRAPPAFGRRPSTRHTSRAAVQHEHCTKKAEPTDARHEPNGEDVLLLSRNARTARSSMSIGRRALKKP